ncbi:MAG: hypothetical protein M3498_11800 [Deinococcota bacterium]|jgi:hypothetical protein|nr:hypothetical protein [Deinococcota bacterium]
MTKRPGLIALRLLLGLPTLTASVRQFVLQLQPGLSPINFSRGDMLFGMTSGASQTGEYVTTCCFPGFRGHYTLLVKR